MGRRTRRTHSKRRHSKRQHSKRRHSKRRYRGGNLGAPLNYSLATSGPSAQSLRQGGDFLQFHKGQHGGVAPLSSIGGELIPAGARASAHLGGIDRAFGAIGGLSDRVSTGGRRSRRRNRSGSRRKRNGGRHTRRHRRIYRNKKRRGGGLSGAPFPNPGMLLTSPTQYAQAGLNPAWKTDVAFGAARLRDTQ